MCLVSIQVTYETQRLYKYHKNTSQVRLLKMREIQSHNDELHRNLVRTLNIRRNQDIVLQKYRLDLSSRFALKRDMDRTLRQRKGAAKWPLWVVQLICELLVSGTPPTSIPSNIEILYETLYSASPKSLPSVSFVRSCRTIVQVLGETISAYKLAKDDNWKQIFFDATTRRQVPFQAVIIGLMSSDKLDPVIVSSCIFMEDETSEKQVEGILEKVSLR